MMTSPSLQNRVILIAEDEPDLRLFLSESLELSGAKVVSAENGKVALDLLMNNPVDLIVSDVRMPGGDGISFLEEVRKINPDTPPFFFFSGYADISAQEAVMKGAQAMFHKPLDARTLLETIESFFQKDSSESNA